MWNLLVEFPDNYFTGGIEILPGLRSEKMYFNPIIYTYKWDQYKWLPQIEQLNSHQLKIDKLGQDKPEKLDELCNKALACVDEKLLINEIGLDFYSFEPIWRMIFARTLVLGVWKASIFVDLSFLSHYKRKYWKIHKI